jgi:hypothetical protein
MFDTSPSGISALVAQGEGPSIEFKTRFQSKDQIGRRLLSFANSGGGILLIGVADNGEIVGLPDKEISSAMSRVRELAQSMALQQRSGLQRVDGKAVVFVEVPAARHSVGYMRVAQQLEVRQRFRRFLIESFLIIAIFSCLWFLSGFRLPLISSALRVLFPDFRLVTVAITDLTLFLFFSTVYYGTANEVTPFKLALAIFWPFTRIFKKRLSIGYSRIDDIDSAISPASADSNNRDTESIDQEEEEKDHVPLRQSEGAGGIPVETTDGFTSNDADVVSVLAVDRSDDLFREVSERASYFANRMEKRTNTYMIVGVGMGFLGMFFWFWSFRTVLALPTTLVGFAEMAIPRVTILVFIELLAGFFLRQYRIGVEDFKYFFEIEQRAAWKRISYSILSNQKGSKGLQAFATSLAIDFSITKLKSGESTPTLEALKAEGNMALDAMKVVSNAVQEVAKSAKQAKALKQKE